MIRINRKNNNKPDIGFEGKYVQSCIITSIMFLFIFGWKFTSFLDIILFTSLFFCLYFFLHNGRFSKIAVNYILLLSVPLIYGLIITSLKGSVDLQFIFRTTRAIINLLGSYIFVCIYRKKYGEFAKNTILKDLEICLLLHAVLMFFMYINKDFAFSIYEITGKATDRGSILLGNRVSGLTYALSQLSVIQMWGGIIIIYNYFYNNQVSKNGLVLIAKISVIIFSILVSGRTGILFGVFLLPISFISFMIRGNRKNRAKILKILISIVFVILILNSINLLSLLPDKFSAYTLMRLNDVFTFIKTGESSVFEQVKNFWTVVPDNTLDFLFGTSSLGRSEYLFIDSDPGLNKILFAVGLVGSILYYIPTFYSIIIIARMMKGNRELSIVALFIIISNFVLNFKELAIYTRNQWSIITIVFFLLCSENTVMHKTDANNYNIKNVEEVSS